MTNKNSIKIAYLIFLILSVIYYIISSVFHLKFEIWEKLVCAATIASYFFTIANAAKISLSARRTIRNSIKYTNKEMMRIAKELEPSLEKDDDDFQSIGNINDFVANKEEVVQRINKSIKKDDQWIFVLNIIGYTMFFFILTFEDFFRFFVKLQGFYTLLAFILIIATEIYQEWWIEKYSSLVKNEKRLYNQEEKEDQ